MTTQQDERFIPPLTLGWRLRMARAHTGLGVREFAQEIGVSHGTVTSAELDQRAVRPITIKMWAMATGVDLDWLENGTTPAGPGGPDGGQVPYAIRDSNPEPADSVHSVADLRVLPSAA